MPKTTPWHLFPKLNASQALFYLNDKDAHSFDKIPESKDKNNDFEC